MQELMQVMIRSWLAAIEVGGCGIKLNSEYT